MKAVRDFIVEKTNPYLIDKDANPTDLSTFKRVAIIVPVYIGLVINKIVDIFIILPALFIFVLIGGVLKACFSAFQMAINDVICNFIDLNSDTKGVIRVIKGTHGKKN